MVKKVLDLSIGDPALDIPIWPFIHSADGTPWKPGDSFINPEDISRAPFGEPITAEDDSRIIPATMTVFKSENEAKNHGDSVLKPNKPSSDIKQEQEYVSYDG